MEVTLPTQAEKRRVVEAMFDRIAPRYDRMNALISFGAHRRWKRAAVAGLAVTPGAVIVDLACGTGDLSEEITRVGGRALGVDVSAGMLREARLRTPAMELARGDGAALPFGSDTVDGIACGFALRNFVQIGPVFREMARVLRPGGRIALVEVDRPANALVRRAHGLYFERFVPWLGGMLSDRWAYSYLPSSAAYLPDAVTMRALLVDAGFEGIVKRRLMAGAAQLLTARKGPGG